MVLGVFLCLMVVVSGAVDSPSSPDASREDACSWSLLDGVFEDVVRAVFRFLLVAFEPADDGEDIVW